MNLKRLQDVVAGVAEGSLQLRTRANQLQLAVEPEKPSIIDEQYVRRLLRLCDADVRWMKALLKAAKKEL